MSWLQFQYHDLSISLTDIVADLVEEQDKEKRTALQKEYEFVFRIFCLYYQGIVEGWEEFDWQKAHEKGWFSQKDYETIPELRDYGQK